MEYLGHFDAETGKGQLLRDHLEGVAALAAKFAEAFGAREFGEIAGRFHDVGKYSTEFQTYLRGERKSGGAHSTGGAQVLYQKKNMSLIPAAWAIAGHHAGLADWGSKADDAGNPSFRSRMQKKLPPFSVWQEEIDGEIAVNRNLSVISKDLPVDEQWYGFQFFTRMLFSCLVDADYLDTEAFYQSCLNTGKQGQVSKRSGFDTLEILGKRFEETVQRRFLSRENARYDEPINVHRREILEACLREGTEGRDHLYRLTVPTGGGKTIASLGFALRRAAQAESKASRIIYIIPYTSIIKQNAKVFQGILGAKNVGQSFFLWDERLSPFWGCK